MCCRYGVAKALQSSTNPVLKGMPVGRLGHIVSLCVNRGWLRFDGLRAVNTVNSQPRSASGGEWDVLVQRICSLICADGSYDGIILGDLKDRLLQQQQQQQQQQPHTPPPGSIQSSANASTISAFPSALSPTSCAQFPPLSCSMTQVQYPPHFNTSFQYYSHLRATGRSNNVVCPGPPSKLQDMRCCVLQAALEYGSSGVRYDVLVRRLEEAGIDVRGQVFAFTDLASALASMPGLRCIAPHT